MTEANITQIGAVAPTLTIDDIRAAAGRIAGHVVRTDMDHSRTLSKICGCKSG
jgi:threonine dehydratase